MKAISSRTLAISCLQACAIGFGAGWLARSYPVNTVPKGAFFLLVEMEFKSIADREKAEAIFAPEARWCRDHEPGTLSYEWARSEQNDRAIVVVERATPTKRPRTRRCTRARTRSRRSGRSSRRWSRSSRAIRTWRRTSATRRGSSERAAVRISRK